MKLNHLMQAYKINGIEAKIKEENEVTDINNNKEKVGVISFDNEISASYLLDSEDIVIAIKIFFNCLIRENLKVKSQLSHVIKVITVMQNTIMLLANISQIECNMILQKLGLFDNTFKDGRQIKHLEHEYKIEVINGILCLSINETNQMKDNNMKRDIK